MSPECKRLAGQLVVYHPASWGQVPSRAGWRPLTLPGARTGSTASPPPAPGPPSPHSQLARPSVCPSCLGSCLDGSRSPLPRSRGCSGLVPLTCSLLVTSRAGGTMGWGCHSNQTGRHNPGMCAAPPPPPCRGRSRRHPRPAAGLALRGAVGGAARVWRVRAEAAESLRGRHGGAGGLGGRGGRRPPSSRRDRLARRAGPSGSSRVKAGTAPGGRGAPTSPPPRTGHAGPAGHRRGAAAAVRGGDGERGGDVR